MKKKISFLLALVIILSLCACGTVQKPEPTPSPTPSPTPKPTATPIPKCKDRKFIDRVLDGFFDTYLPDHLVSKCPDKDIIKKVRVSIGSKDYDMSSDERTVVTCHGTFTGYDAYGDYVGKYKFDFEWSLKGDSIIPDTRLTVYEDN